jgi:hypothetical protein
MIMNNIKNIDLTNPEINNFIIYLDNFMKHQTISVSHKEDIDDFVNILSALIR